MKYSLLILLFINCIDGFSQTNVYHPYPQGWGATWQTEKYIGGTAGSGITYRETEWGGDTIINSVTYTKVYNGIGAGHQYIGGVRQNIALEEAYFIDEQNVEHDISFNQHAIVGDTIMTTMLTEDSPFALVPFSGYEDTLFVVTYIDSIPVEGAYRKFFMMASVGGFPNIASASFLSGVGFINYYGFEWAVTLRCHSVDHNWLYGGSPNPICILGTQNIPVEPTLSMLPNPTSGELVLNKIPKKVDIYSLDGQKIKFQLNGNTLDISNCSQGVYLVYLEFDEGFVTKKIIKR